MIATHPVPNEVEIRHQVKPLADRGPSNTVPIVPAGSTASTAAEVPGLCRRLRSCLTRTELPIPIVPGPLVAATVGVLDGVRVGVAAAGCSMR